MTLEIKHIAPYSIYDLKYFVDFEDGDTAIYSMIGFFVDSGEIYLDGYETDLKSKNCKPILRPLYDLTKEDWKEEVLMHYADLDIEIVVYHSGNDDKNDFGLSITYKIMGDVFTDLLINRGSTRGTERHFFEWLLENHFDVFGLIPNGLAIDINTL